MLLKEGDLYVSAVEGHVVARFGSGSATMKDSQIGVYPVVEATKNGGSRFVGLRWDLGEIVRIPRESYLAHLKAYDNALADKSLKLRSKPEYDAFVEAQAAKTKAEEDKRKAEAAEKAKVEKEAAEKAVAEAAEKAKATEAAKSAAKKES